LARCVGGHPAFVGNEVKKSNAPREGLRQMGDRVVVACIRRSVRKRAEGCITAG
jgi:hypothetical protein